MLFDAPITCDLDYVDAGEPEHGGGRQGQDTKAEEPLGERRRSVDKRHVPGALRVLIKFLLLCLASACWVEARGETEAPLGKIEHIKGGVLVQRSNGLELRGETGMALYPGDQIKAEAHVVRSSRGAICNSRHNAARFSEVGRVGMGQKPHANQAGCFQG